MLVTIRYFAVIREALGKPSETRDVSPGTTAGALTDTVLADAPRLARVRRSLMLMVNQEYVDADHVLGDGDELALIPPVSGGEHRYFRVTAEVLDPREVEQVVAGPDRGAVVTFTGAVRNQPSALAGQPASGLDAVQPGHADVHQDHVGVELTGERHGLLAVCLQHEMDHLEGILFIDHLSRLKRERAVAKVKKQAKAA